MVKSAEVALMVGILWAVLAFGGAEPGTFALVEVLLLGVSALVVAGPGFGALRRLKGFGVPALLVAAVLLQLCPLPRFLLPLFARPLPRPSVSQGTLTLAPYDTQAQVLILLTCLAGFYLAQIIAQEKGGVRRLITFLVALGAFESMYGLIQYLSGWQMIFTYAKKYDLEEATGTYINRNHFAGFLEMILPLCLALVLYEYWKLRGNGRQSFTRIKTRGSRQRFPGFIFFLFVAIMLSVGLTFSRSRMGIIASAVSILVIFGVASLQRKSGLLLSGLFIVLSVGLAGWIGARSVVGRFENVGQEYTVKNESRLSIWQGTGTLIRNHPWLGAGLGTFPVAYTEVQSTFLTQFVNHAHNDYLEIASDLGIPAAMCLFVSILFILVRALRDFSRGESRFERAVALGCAGSIVAILLHSLTDFNLHIPANALVFSVILGIAMSRSRASRNRASVEVAA